MTETCKHHYHVFKNLLQMVEADAEIYTWLDQLDFVFFILIDLLIRADKIRILLNNLNIK